MALQRPQVSFRFLLPGPRPVDEMELAWGSVFEDEFALCLMGARSPYESITFPNTWPMRPALLNPDALTPAELGAWRELLLEFLRKLSVAHAGRRLVFKSPPTAVGCGCCSTYFRVRGSFIS
jgi:omega-hydroxy-beta-dihydromenaquinone-9 sulfotransferase